MDGTQVKVKVCDCGIRHLVIQDTSILWETQAPALHLLKGEDLKAPLSCFPRVTRGRAEKVKSCSPVPSRGPRARCSQSDYLFPGLLGFMTSLFLG